MSSSSIPTLSDVLFYTANDSYNYLVDNRPIQQLADNVMTTAASLVGIGYGEHSSTSGSLLAQGKAVELQTNGTIAYPSPIVSLKTGIYGLVIGSTNGGLNKVIWRSSLLDLESLGLQSLIPTATIDQVIVAEASTGTISAVDAGAITQSSIVLGTVLTFPYITIGRYGTSLTIDPSAMGNMLNNYGVSRKQNLTLLSSIDASPIQFSKTVYRTSGALVGRLANPLFITLNDGTGVVNIDTTTPDTTNYGDNKWILKEKYTKFTTAGGANADVSLTVNGAGSSANTWSTTAGYPTTFAAPFSGITNFELNATTAEVLSNFNISKYFQYPLAVGNAATKPIVIVTVLDPTGGGSELNPVVVCDFITYVTGEVELSKKRVTLVGATAANFLAALPTAVTLL